MKENDIDDSLNVEQNDQIDLYQLDNFPYVQAPISNIIVADGKAVNIEMLKK